MTNLRVPLRQEVIQAFPWLSEELGFLVIEDAYRFENFGNSFVTLESQLMLVRFVRDRGQVWIDVAAPTDRKKWWHVTFVLEAIHGEAPQPTFELGGVADRFRKHFSELVEALGPDYPDTKRELERREVARLQKLRASKPAT